MKIKILFFLLLSTAFIHATIVDFTANDHQLLSKSEIFLDKENSEISKIKEKTDFKQVNTSHINLGFVGDKSLWIRLTFYNRNNMSEQKILEVRNPLLESVVLYDKEHILKKGTLYQGDAKNTIHTTFEIILAPKETRTIYIEVKNKTTTLNLDLALKEKIQFLKDEYKEEIKISIFFTIILLLLLYSVILYLYTKEKIYLYYAFYLFALIFQQSTYLGITQMFFPPWFIYYDDLSVVLKVNLMYITAIMFAREFLHTSNYKRIDNIYKVFLVFAIIEIPLFGTKWFYVPEIAIFTALIFIYFNLYAGIYIYKQGYTHARLFVFGWAFQVFGFTLMILDGLGIVSVMYKFPNLVMFLTSVEAIILSTSFIDRYQIFRKQKEQADKILVEELTNRQKIIESEIEKQTKDLNDLVENKQLLLKELQHRIKNNLQLIISLVRIQSDKADAKMKQSYEELENRIRTIAKTHQMFYLKKDIQKIDMFEYIDELCSDLEQLSQKKLEWSIDADSIYMPVKEASYLGLIINEVVTNSIKYVKRESVHIDIDIDKNDGEFTLKIKDNGDGFEYENIQPKGMGIMLIKTLVENQLDGILNMNVDHGMVYTIRFSL